MAVFTLHGIRNPQGSALQEPFFRKHGHTEAPVVVQCHLTLRCALSCDHCLAVHAKVAAADMPLLLFEQLCQEAADLGVQEMLLTGGEPLGRSDLGEVVDCLRRHRLFWSLNTAVCPDELQQAAILRHPPGYVAVSLDGPADIHNVIRGSPAAFDQALDAIRFFSGIPGTTVCAGTTLTTRNLPHFEETSALVRTSGADRWGIHLLLPEGRAETRQDLYPSRSQLRTLLKNIALKRRVMPVSLCDELGFAGEWEPLVRDEAFFCAAGRAMCAVLPDGSVMPCSTLDPRHSQGNLNQTALADIWRNGFDAQRNFKPAGKCTGCPDLAVCRSGCWLQRVHGSQCFRSLWKIPDSFKDRRRPRPLPGWSWKPTGTGTNYNCGFRHRTPGSLRPWRDSFRCHPGPYAILSNKAGGGLSRLPFYEIKQPATRSALLWLQQQQNADGTWGSPHHQASLTPLAILAYLSQGETTASYEFGQTVEKGLRFLFDSRSAEQPNARLETREDILTVWCLAEAYAMTRIPTLRNVLPEDPGLLLEGQPSLWHFLAWAALYRSGIGDTDALPPVEEIVARLPTDLDPITRQSLMIHLSWHPHTRGIPAEWLGQLEEMNLRDWKQLSRPLESVLLINWAMAHSEWTHRLSWDEFFVPAAASSQQRLQEIGYWEPADLFDGPNLETQGMTDEDTRIYTTAFMVMSLRIAMLP
jgi:radical SAM protein with 4Fe4S-binding SPASM domain